MSKREGIKMEETQTQKKEETQNQNAFNLDEKEISSIYQSLNETIIPEIQENEKIMAQSYESMVNDRTPLI